MTDGAPLLGIDLGTQSVKVAAVRDGQILASATRPYRVDSPRPGWAQSDVDTWLAAIDSAVEEVVAAAGTPQAVGLSGQMHGVVVTDEQLTPLTPAIIWADGRSASQARAIGERLGAAVLSQLGSAAFPGFMGPTAAWLVENEPDTMRSARWLLSPKDFIRARLTGTVATDVSDASGTLLLDVITGGWDPAAFEACGIDPDLAPGIVSSNAEAAVIGAGPLSGVPIAVGGADTACVIHGLGLSAGQGYLGLGSGTQIVSVCSQPAIDPTLRTHTFAAVGDPGSGWYRLGAVQSGGIVLDRALAWLAATPDDVTAALSQSGRPDDPLFWPFLSGERTPYLDPDLRGAWEDLSLTTDRGALIRSVFEGMAFAVAIASMALADVPPHPPIPVLGGGSRDRGYLQQIADLTGWPLAPVAQGDGAVVGAARLAADMVGAPMPGLLSSDRRGDVVEPRGSTQLTERFHRWRDRLDATLGS